MYKKNVESSKSLGKREAALLSKLAAERLTIFSPTEVCRFLGCKRNAAYRIVHSLKRKGWVKGLTGGKYQLLTLAGSPTEDLLVLACSLVWPSYVSLWTALNYYKLTEQVPRAIFLVTTSRKREKKLGDVRVQFVQLSRDRFFGYARIDNICMAEREKAIVDSLSFPRYVSLSEVCKALDAAREEISFEKLIEYSIKMKNASLLKRLGFLIELLDIKLAPKLFKSLQRRIGKGYSLLDPTRPRFGNYNKRWLLSVNVGREELIYWRRVG